MTSRILLLALSLALACPAGAGTLTTRDGKHLAGSLAVGEDRITVMTDSGPQAVPLANVAEADFKAGGAEAAKAGHGLRGDYFAGRSLRQLMLTRVDPAIDYEWSDTLPHPSLAGASREFSARWTGRLRPDHSEKYALIADTDDGVRVWLDGRLVIDRWFDQNGGAAPVEVSLEKDRRYDLRVEYYNGHGAARAVLSWSSPSTPRQVIPAENLYLPAAATSA
ncbi:MAG TPA: PA14 domain-containing protein, partial [Tepidisphaeraceae bacterium]